MGADAAACSSERTDYYQTVIPELCVWTLESSSSYDEGRGRDGGGGPMPGGGSSSSRVLTLHLALPPPNEEEILYKKGT